MQTASAGLLALSHDVCISSIGPVRCIRTDTAVRQEAVATPQKASAGHMQHVRACCGCHPSFHPAASTSASQLCSHNRSGDVLQEPDAGSQAADASRMRDVMSRCGALGSERLRASFKTNNLEQDLTRLLKSGNVEQHRDVLERKLASSALAGGHFMCCPFLQFPVTSSIPLPLHLWQGS